MILSNFFQNDCPNCVNEKNLSSLRLKRNILTVFQQILLLWFIGNIMVKRDVVKLVLCVWSVLTTLIILNNFKFQDYFNYQEENYVEKVTIATVGCKDRTEELVNMLKSVLFYNVDEVNIHFVIFAEPDIFLVVEEQLNDWSKIVNFELTYEIHHTWFPKENNDQWRKAFRQCATQRLFIPVSKPRRYQRLKLIPVALPETVKAH